MGGQDRHPGSLHLDMRRLNRVLASIVGQQDASRVQAGIAGATSSASIRTICR